MARKKLLIPPPSPHLARGQAMCIGTFVTKRLSPWPLNPKEHVKVATFADISEPCIDVSPASYTSSYLTKVLARARRETNLGFECQAMISLVSVCALK